MKHDDESRALHSEVDVSNSGKGYRYTRLPTAPARSGGRPPMTFNRGIDDYFSLFVSLGSDSNTVKYEIMWCGVGPGAVTESVEISREVFHDVLALATLSERRMARTGVGRPRRRRRANRPPASARGRRSR